MVRARTHAHMPRRLPSSAGGILLPPVAPSGPSDTSPRTWVRNQHLINHGNSRPWPSLPDNDHSADTESWMYVPRTDGSTANSAPLQHRHDSARATNPSIFACARDHGGHGEQNGHGSDLRELPRPVVELAGVDDVDHGVPMYVGSAQKLDGAPGTRTKIPLPPPPPPTSRWKPMEWDGEWPEGQWL